MKILYYNWVDYLDSERRGGGVSVYQRNLIEALAQTPEVDPWFLSSGVSYDLRNRAPRWARISHGPADRRDRRFEIINSEVLAPSHFSFSSPAQVSAEATKAAFFDFVRTNGPFDIIHFNNLEGVPAEVLSVRDLHPQTRVVFSLHNYYPVCPQVNLWREETEHCDDFENGRACRGCLERDYDESIIRTANAVAFLLKRYRIEPGTFLFDFAFGRLIRTGGRALKSYARLRRAVERKLGRTTTTTTDPAPARGLKRLAPMAAHFAGRRAAFVDLINRHCDRVLGVSQRVSRIAIGYGISARIVQTAYIGTRQADKYSDTKPTMALTDSEGHLTLGYLGYMRRDKGYHFLVEALSALPPETAARIRLVIAAPKGTEEAMKDLRDLSDHLREIVYSDGYSHEDLDLILASVTVGVVPVLWEDNLPQVAIEMHARHIPLLTSDRGGASELGGFAEMVFRSGDIASFTARIDEILSGQIDIDAYWAGAQAPKSMQEHVTELLAIYADCKAASPLTAATG